MEEHQLTKKERRAARRQERQQKQHHTQRHGIVRHLLLWVGVLAVIGGSIFGLVQLGGGRAGGSVGILTDTVSPQDHAKGNVAAPVILVEYGDFQCPACAAYHGFVKQLNEEMGDRVRVVYRHFPLRQIHRNADAAARASEAAGKQGKFWEMHDLLYEGQRQWADLGNPNTVFASYVASLGLDEGQFFSAMDSAEIRQKVENDYQSGLRAGVDGTPSFFLNGGKIQNPKNYDAFKRLIEDAAGRSTQTGDNS